MILVLIQMLWEGQGIKVFMQAFQAHQPFRGEDAIQLEDEGAISRARS